MEEVMSNITLDEVLDIMVDFPLKPIRNKLIISVNTKEEDDIELGELGFDESQFVIASGSNILQSIMPGCKVLLDLDKMSTKTHDEEGNITYGIQIKPVKVDGRMFAIINDTVIDAVDKR